MYFEDTYICLTGSGCVTANTYYNTLGATTIFNMDQNCGTSNTNQNWINGYGYMGIYGYSKNTWVTSQYNWWCV